MNELVQATWWATPIELELPVLPVLLVLVLGLTWLLEVAVVLAALVVVASVEVLLLMVDAAVVHCHMLPALAFDHVYLRAR
jgi:hypothetical protein